MIECEKYTICKFRVEDVKFTNVEAKIYNIRMGCQYEVLLGMEWFIDNMQDVSARWRMLYFKYSVQVV